jgi:hypothetical protein
MTWWIERRDETADGVTDGAAMGGATTGPWRRRDHGRQCGHGRRGRTLAARRRGGSVEENNGATAGSREDGGDVEERRRIEKTKITTVVALYRLHHRLIRCGGKRTSVQI